MKLIVILLATASIVVSLPQNPQGTAPVQATPGAAPVAPVNPFGAGFFGPGINNPLALSPDPSLVGVARQILQSNPNLRARVNTNGQVEITDQFGVARKIVDAFGNNPLDPEERFELEQERREFQLEQQEQQAELRLRQQLLQLQLGQINSVATAQAPAQALAQAPQAGSAVGGNGFFVTS